jgi:hypothetical protein
MYQRPVMNNGITWVQGIEGAKAFQMTPNSNAILMDSENDGRFYIKVSDNVGMCNLRRFKYVEETDTPTQAVDMSKYVTRQELEDAIRSIRNEQSVSTAAATTGAPAAKPKVILQNTSKS